MNKIKQLKNKYQMIFNHINNENYFDNLNMRFELDKIDFEYITATSQYFIKEKIDNNIYTISFGKIKLLDNKIRFYLLITCNYITILDIEKDIKRK